MIEWQNAKLRRLEVLFLSYILIEKLRIIEFDADLFRFINLRFILKTFLVGYSDNISLNQALVNDLVALTFVE